jgi:signal transduction histidine kinase
VQIVDISEKVLNKEIMAEKVLLTMINATVSHELRNPLSSLISQISAMEHFLDKLRILIEQEDISNIKSSLISIFNGLANSGKRIVCAANFIDFFVHDILDYTILNKDSNKFTKKIEVFSIKLAVAHIT